MDGEAEYSRRRELPLLGMMMPKRAKQNAAQVPPAAELKGWRQIAAFLGEPASVVQRWASEGMPVRREGRLITTTPEELNVWLGKETGKPVHVATENTDLTAELKRGLSFVRHEKPQKSDSGTPKKGNRR